MNTQLFPLGRVVADLHALEAIPTNDIETALAKHASGDWGDLDPEDIQANNTALETGERILSAYEARNSVVFWIITEADRSVTTILLPESY